MKNYEFSICLCGRGETPEEAWEEAIEGFSMEPGCITEDETTFIEELNEDGDEYEPRRIIKDLRRELI